MLSDVWVLRSIHILHTLYGVFFFVFLSVMSIFVLHCLASWFWISLSISLSFPLSLSLSVSLYLKSKWRALGV